MSKPATQDRRADLVRRWRDVLACYSNVSCALDRRLQDEFGIGMSEFEALDRLVDATAEKLKMHQLAAGMYLSQSALSRTVARLERHGLVERSLCASDRRAIFVRLTPAGRELHGRARQAHSEVLAAHMPMPEPGPGPAAR